MTARVTFEVINPVACKKKKKEHPKDENGLAIS